MRRDHAKPQGWGILPIRLRFKALHGQEVPEADMPDNASGVVQFVCGYQDFLGQRVQILKCPEFALAHL